MVNSVRVLVVDDSVVVRRLVTEALQEDPGIEVVGVAANGRIALDKIEQLGPDLVTLDIEMPVMDGLTTLRRIRGRHPEVSVVMFSTLTDRGASATLTALENGADDYVTKPSSVSSIGEAREVVRRELVPKILALAGRGRTSATASRTVRKHGPPRRPSDGSTPVGVLVIGASTGGPDALTTLLTSLPADLPVPVVVVQHMPPVFTRHFAERLDGKCALRVSEAVAGDVVQRGRVLIAPGDWHLRLTGTPSRPVVALDQGPRENFCRPAVDVLFSSAAEVFGRRVLALVMTGMGADGAAGATDIAAAGGEVYVQDEATSVVWGMPGAAHARGVASQVLPLPEIADALVARVSTAASRGAAGLAGGRR